MVREPLENGPHLVLAEPRSGINPHLAEFHRPDQLERFELQPSGVFNGQLVEPAGLQQLHLQPLGIGWMGVEQDRVDLGAEPARRSRPARPG